MALFNKSDTFEVLKYKMLSLVLGTDNYDLQTLVQAYANHYFMNLDKLNKDLEKYHLKEFIWNQIKERYRYKGRGTKHL